MGFIERPYRTDSTNRQLDHRRQAIGYLLLKGALTDTGCLYTLDGAQRDNGVLLRCVQGRDQTKNGTHYHANCECQHDDSKSDFGLNGREAVERQVDYIGKSETHDSSG